MTHIGIVSKEAHAKSHGNAIRKMGYQVTMLGGSPQSIPPSIDIVICRPASVSHNGYNCTMQWKRRGGEVIVTNSLDAMVKALTDNKQQEPILTEFFRSQDVVMHFVSALGIYGPHLHDERSKDIVTQLAINRSTSAQEVDDVLLSWEGALRSITRDAIRSHCKKAIEKKESSFRKLYSRRLRGGVRTYGFAVEDNDALALFLLRSDLSDSRPSGKRAKNARKKTFAKPKVAAVPLAPPEPAVGGLIASDPVPVPQAVKTEPIGVSPPESAPLFASVTPVEASGGKGDDMADLRSALEMLVAEMDELSISEITVLSDGSYRFQRVVVTDHSGKVEKTW